MTEVVEIVEEIEVKDKESYKRILGWVIGSQAINRLYHVPTPHPDGVHWIQVSSSADAVPIFPGDKNAN